MKHLTRIAALLLLTAALAGCAQQAAAPVATPEIQPTPLPTAAPTEVVQAPVGGGIYEDSADDYPDEVLNGVATEEDVLPMHASFDEAAAVNDEVIGWVTVPGTNIDYPVTRTDNNKYYLKRNVDKKKSKYGCVFMDYRNADVDQQKHIILYGHNMKNGTMFHELNNYKQREFFDANRYVFFYWGGVDTEWEIFCAYTVRIDEVYPINTRFGSDQNFADVMNDTVEYARTVRPSVIDEGVMIAPGDQVLTLLTCTYEYDNSRFGVMARRVK